MGATDLHDEYLNTALSILEMIEIEEPGEGQAVRFFSCQKICFYFDETLFYRKFLVYSRPFQKKSVVFFL